MSEVTGNQLIDVYARANDSAGIIATIDQMQTDKLPVKQWAVNAMIKAYNRIEDQLLLNTILSEIQRGTVDVTDPTVAGLFSNRLQGTSETINRLLRDVSSS